MLNPISLKPVIFTFLCFVFIMLFGSGISAQRYNVANIAPELLENANAVIRYDERIFDVRGWHRMVESRKRAITVLSAEASAHANISINYRSGIRVRNLNGTIYDKNGNIIKKLSSSDFVDISYIQDFSVYEDTRVISTDIRVHEYPFTIEYEYSIVNNSVFLNDYFIPIHTSNVSLEKAICKISIPESLSFRYKAHNHQWDEPKITQPRRNRKQYKWLITDVPAIRREFLMPQWQEVFPFIQIGANEMTYRGYSGNVATWEGFGKWVAELNANRQDLSRSTIAKINSLIDGIDDPFKKIEILYEYMQSITRYVSIQIGIGGFQPDPASSVESNGYGDCKALSNFMLAILDVAGIKSYYALIHSGDTYWDFDPDFTFDYFNHAILAVPIENDTLWIEATCSSCHAGFIGKGNADRYALLITEDGGKLVRTPPINQAENIISQKIHATIIDNGSIEVKLHKTYEGLSYGNRRGFDIFPSDFQRSRFMENLGYSSINLTKLEYYKDNETKGVMHKNAEFVVSNYISRAGQRLLLNPFIASSTFQTRRLAENRQHPFRINNINIYMSIVKWQIPEHYTIQNVPEDLTIDSDFLFFEAMYNYDTEANILEVKYESFFKNGTYPPEKFNDYVEIYNTVSHHQSRRIMLVPSSGE